MFAVREENEQETSKAQATAWLLAKKGLPWKKPHLGQAAEAPGSSIGTQSEVGSAESFCWPDYSGQQERQWSLPWLYRILLFSEDQNHKGDERCGETE